MTKTAVYYVQSDLLKHGPYTAKEAQVAAERLNRQAFMADVQKSEEV